MRNADPSLFSPPALRLAEPGPPASETAVETFAREGYVGPLRLFGPAECQGIAAYLQRDDHPAPLDWTKGRAVHERLVYELATDPALLRILTALVGPDIVLWGASAVTRRPGAVHPWHSDIESSDPEGRFVSVWIGIQHTSRESALQMISRSHRLGATVQEVRLARGLRRHEATPEAMLAAAREREPEAALVQPEMTNGEALVFDGRLWHGSDHRRTRGRRLALLFQYAAANNAVRMPDPTQVDWPFRLLPAPPPPAILVSGSDRLGLNRLVPAPPPSSKGLPMVATAIHQFSLPLANPTEPWTPIPAFRGPTRTLAEMGCHASELAGGHCPHPPHAHREEELLIPLYGEVELVLANGPSDPAPRLERLRPGSFVYYPAAQYHTIRNPGTTAVGYLMFKWHAPNAEMGAPLGMGLYHHRDITAPADAPPFWTRRLFQGPTAYLGKLHAHLTVLQPSAGYEPHVDAYDVAIVVLSGTVETLGRRVDPLGVIYCAAGEPHGIRNFGADPARYLVFEFHAPGRRPVSPPPPLHRTLARRVLARVRRLVQRLRAAGRQHDT